MNLSAFKQNAIHSLYIIGLLWVILIFDVIMPIDMYKLGILPRTISGLIGILLAPFLHANFVHLVSNTFILFVLSFIMMSFYRRLALKVVIYSILLGGFGVWLLARQSYHIGASGLIFSLLTFILASGIFRKSPKSILIAVIIFFMYGGALWGVLPTTPGVSWEGHLYGALAGVLLAYIYRNDRADDNPSQFKLFQ